MKQYESYKDSGIEWLGKIPSHWKDEKLKYLVSCNDDVLDENTDPDAIINYVEISDVDAVNGVKLSTQYSFKEAPSRARRIAKKGDVIVSTVRTYLKAIAAIKEDNLIVSTGFAVLRPREIDSAFISYALQNDSFLGEVVSRSTGVSYPAINASDLVEIRIPVPSFSEQRIIATYLDEKVSKIDAIIAEKEKMVEDLQNYRKSIISETVTRGLNPNVPMKDSGVDSIGSIPSSWKVMKTLYCLSMPITDGPHTTPELYDEGIPFISAEAVSCGNGKIDFSHKRGYISQDFYDECCKKYIPQREDIYMIKSGATTGKVAIVDTDELFTIWSPLAVFRCDKNVMLPYFLYFLLQSPLYQTQVELGWSYGTQQNISMRTLEKIKIPVPSLQEQVEIATYIESKISKIEVGIKGVIMQIEDLKSYKSSLITEAVTGKIDLRNS